MFDRIAGVYDRMNHVMTAGLDRRWRERAVERAELEPGESALDVCCGTGDLAFELARRGRARAAASSAATSPRRMLELARAKEEELRLSASRRRRRVERRRPGAGARSSSSGPTPSSCPTPDASFDAVTVGFGVRNLADLEAGLAELTRVLKPGGRLVILEITQPQRPPLSTFFSLWFDRVVPLLGSVAGDSAAYTYLPDSVRSFPPPDRLAALMDGAGLGAHPLARARRRHHRDPLGGPRRMGEPA